MKIITFGKVPVKYKKDFLVVQNYEAVYIFTFYLPLHTKEMNSVYNNFICAHIFIVLLVPKKRIYSF